MGDVIYVTAVHAVAIVNGWLVKVFILDEDTPYEIFVDTSGQAGKLVDRFLVRREWERSDFDRLLSEFAK